jgi:methyltransferase family protein
VTQLPEKARPSGEVEAAAAISRSAPGPRRAAGERLLLTVPILDRMRSVEGWLTDAEADLLIASAAHIVSSFSPSNGIVEVGSYCGRSTVVLASVIAALAPLARVHAIDPHEGEVGAADAGLERTAPTFARFRENIERTEVSPFVIAVRQYSYDVKWSDPIGLLLIDGLHDYENCARDFTHFEPWLVDGAHAAFHDYGSWPGVTSFVDRLLRTQSYRLVERADSMVVLRRALESP